ncbi:MAG: biotin/lipoate A/B protein ligase family protein [Chloroflexi bacterium]|nr:biotin/lipoate A/B protein ligase family protein [Chloroflexota bacterium]
MRSLQDCSFRDGASNMAVDSAILAAVARGDQPPTLRLYGWDPFCLSLGYGQRTRDVDLDALAARGWDLVRRPTGGKAILHGDELTYSLCLPLDHALAGVDIVESYRRISVGLLRALETLGLDADAPRQDERMRGADLGPICFEMPSHYEISVKGRKLIGSAQLRRKGAMLQHGTLPLNGDLARICGVLRFESEASRTAQKRNVREWTLTLAEAAGKSVRWTEAASAFEQGFASAFDLEMRPGQLSPVESNRVEQLIAERFGNRAWTHKR